MAEKEIIIIGGGLAGCEAAWAAARLGIRVKLYEMRPIEMTPAHITGMLAELICSNSLGSNLTDRATGLLKAELQQFRSLLVEVAEKTSVPAGQALAVDRTLFAAEVERRILENPLIEVIRQEVTEIPANKTVIIASGPLTSPKLTESISDLTGSENMFFYDAIAPIISAESIDMSIAFNASRYQKDDSGIGDYLNCPFSREEYEDFVDALITAERIQLKAFEAEIETGVKAGRGAFFEGCLPIEVLAARGKESLAFGPMRPVGLHDPRTGRRPWAVLQLRKENVAATRYNMVGFQTNLKYPEQKRVFRMIPGLKNAEFERFGQMHRNTYLCSPALLNHQLALKSHPNVFIAGQLSGVEGYLGNVATGLVAGINAAASLNRCSPLVLPSTTMTGALIRSITSGDVDHFQPIKANFGILDPLENPAKAKKERARQYAERALETIDKFTNEK